MDMSQPRHCSYQKTDHNGDCTDTIPLIAPPSIDTSATPPVEYRGITLHQLRAVKANVRRLCVKEEWTDRHDVLLTPEAVTLYDVNKYIIVPFTKEAKKSFVTCLPSTAGPQPPRFFMSHWWGESVADFIKCLEQAVRDFARNHTDEDDRRGGGMTADTPVWICAYGNNQHSLGDDITTDPKDSGFAKAMEVSKGRTMTILDKGGIVFTRVWCVFELFMTLV